MARRSRSSTLTDEPFEERILDLDVSQEMRQSFLEYAYSVIYARALPDARDGLKPVQRRILYQMTQMGLRPDRGHVKSARVVGEVMGKLHPHGDSAIYDTLVRLSQPFTLRVPLVDGHGNFGSLDSGPAAMRYTEARLAPAAMAMTASLDEDVVDFRLNYDGREREPVILPAAFPNLLVNGAAGIAVGMATTMAPHNLGEVIAAARHLLAHPDADLDALMRFIPGPDLPCGGTIVGLEGIRQAYETGRGTFRTRAVAHIENITARRRGIVVTELPLGVGPERIRERVGELVRARKLHGVADVEDYTDSQQGTKLVIEVKSGFDPAAVLEQLYRLTPMQESFAINNVALVDGQPRTLGLQELLRIYLDHRLLVVRRRCQYRRDRAAERAHLVDGLLVAILNIDEVLQVIRSSDDTSSARARLMEVFDLSEEQATYILEMPLRRLTRFSRLELETEQAQLQATVEELDALLADPQQLATLVSGELAQVAQELGTPRRTALVHDDGSASLSAASPASLEVADQACLVVLSATGLLARTELALSTPTGTGQEATAQPGAAAAGWAAVVGASPGQARARHDVIASVVGATTRGQAGLVTSHGRMVRLPVQDLPSLPSSSGYLSLAGAAPAAEFADLQPGERVLAVAAMPEAGAPTPGAGLALGTRLGVVKRVVPDYPNGAQAWPIIRLADGDEVVGAQELTEDSQRLVFITSDAQLLHFPASTVRAQGRTGGGIAGIKLSANANVIAFGVASLGSQPGARVVSLAGDTGSLFGQVEGTVKISALDDFPGKNRAGAGVRCHRFLRTETRLLAAWVGQAVPLACGQNAEPVDLPTTLGKRDGSGSDVSAPLAALGHAVSLGGQ